METEPSSSVFISENGCHCVNLWTLVDLSYKVSTRILVLSSNATLFIIKIKKYDEILSDFMFFVRKRF